MKVILKWFNLNSLEANPENFQFMIIGKSVQPKYCVTIGPINAKESDYVGLLGITIDKNLSFKKHVLKRIYVRMRITNCMVLGV